MQISGMLQTPPSQESHTRDWARTAVKGSSLQYVFSFLF
jgi:hypothetical protein